MSTDNLYRRIESSGVNGVPKAQLKKEFDVTSDQLFDGLLSKGLIFEEKKDRRITYWSKDNYVHFLLGNDPKFKLIFDLNSKANNTISDTISKINSELNNKVTTVTEELKNKVNSDTISKINSELNNKVATVFNNVLNMPSPLFTGFSIHWFFHSLVFPFTMAYDVDPLQLRRNKRELLGKIADRRWLALFDHDPDRPAARVRRGDIRGFHLAESWAAL